MALGRGPANLFLGLAGGTLHLQVVYYTLISAGFLTLFYFIDSWKKKEVKSLLIGMAIAAGAALIGFSTLAVANLPTAEYAQETMRGGKTELTGVNSGKTTIRVDLAPNMRSAGGYGIPETFNLLVPNAQGPGDHGKAITGNSKFADKLTEVGVPEDQALAMANAYSYWVISQARPVLPIWAPSAGCCSSGIGVCEGLAKVLAGERRHCGHRARVGQELFRYK